MNILGVQLPDELNRALANGSLVIFAGAGVSMQHPKPLASFVELVKSASEQFDPLDNFRIRRALDQGEDVNLEAALGLLSQKGDVHAYCASLLEEETCSELHKHILTLGNQLSARVVTTNFDHRFECAAKELDIAPRIYNGPALPKGDDFTGIVHLHGSIRYPHEMVLTDSDFGKAYVSDGWAARFLVKMFSRYTVLFVGYSCSDMLVHYLARSISADMKGKVFALVRSDEESNKWRYRGISPVQFSEFNQLPVLFEEWGRRTRLSLYERANVVSSAAAKGEDLDEGLRTELRRLLSDSMYPPEERAALAESFAQSANGASSFRLLVAIGVTSFLYDDEFPSEQEPLFRWVVRDVALSDYRAVLLEAAKADRHLSKGFCSTVLWALHSGGASEDCLAAWLAYFEPQYISRNGSWYALVGIAEKTANPRVVLRVLKLAFSFSTTYKAPQSGEQEGFAAQFCFDSDAETKRMARAALAHSDEIGKELFSYLVEKLEEKAEIESAFGTSSLPFDSDSFSRSAIEEHEQDAYLKGTIHVLVSLARDLGLELINHGLLDASAVERLCVSRSCFVMRLGLFFLRHVDVDADCALDVLLAAECKEDLSAKHEVFMLIRFAYPRLSESGRRKLMDYVHGKYPDLASNFDAYGRFNIFRWLLRDSPEDSLLKGELSEIKQRYPNFKEREYPDLSWSTSSCHFEDDLLPPLREQAFSAEALLKRLDAVRKEGRPIILYEVVEQPMKAYPARAIVVCLDLLESGEDGKRLAAASLSQIAWKDVPSSAWKEASALLSRCLVDDKTYQQALFGLHELALQEGFLIQEGSDELVETAIDGISRWNRNAKSCERTDWLTTSINAPVGLVCDIVKRSDVCAGSDDAKGEVTHARVQKLVRLVENDAFKSNCLAASLLSEVSYWTNANAECAKACCLPFLEVGSLGFDGALCGLGYLNLVSEKAWMLIRERWQTILPAFDSMHSNQRIAGVCALYVRCSVFYDAPPERNCIVASCRAYPELCSVAIRVLVDWTLHLEGDCKPQEWGRWIFAAISQLLENEDCYKEAAAGLRRLLKAEGLPARDAIRIIAKYCERECGSRLFWDIPLDKIVACAEITDEEKACFLRAMLKNADYFAMEREDICNAINGLDVSKTSEKTCTALRELCVLRLGGVVPEALKSLK